MRRIALRVIALLFALAISSGIRPTPPPARAFDMKICEYCHRLWDDSPCRMRASADARGHEKTILVCSPYCLAEVLKLKPWYKLGAVQVCAYDDRDSIEPIMLSADSARFLSGVKDEQDRSHEPHVAAFRTDKELVAGKPKLGGETLTWDKLLAKCKKLAAKHDDSEDSDYVPLHHRHYP